MATGKQEGKDIKYSLVINEDALYKMKYIAVTNQDKIKDAVAEAFDAYIKAYEKKNGEIKLPAKK